MSEKKYLNLDGVIRLVTNIISKLDAGIKSANDYTDVEIANLVDSAPETLNTLGELATALQENKDITDVLNDAIANKAESSDLTSHVSNTSNPHNVTTAQLGLSVESWTFTLDDGSTVTKSVVIK